MDGLYHPFIVILEITYSWAYQITIFQTNQHQHLGNSALRHVAVWESSLLIASQQDVCHQRKTRQGNDYVQMWVNAHLLQWKMLKHLWNWFSWLSIIIHPKGSAAQSKKPDSPRDSPTISSLQFQVKQQRMATVKESWRSTKNTEEFDHLDPGLPPSSFTRAHQGSPSILTAVKSSTPQTANPFMVEISIYSNMINYRLTYIYITTYIYIYECSV